MSGPYTKISIKLTMLNIFLLSVMKRWIVQVPRHHVTLSMCQLTRWVGGCRLQDLVQEVDALPAEGPQGLAMPRIQGPPGSKMLGVQVAGGGGYKAPLLARVHLRLGMWSWTYEVASFGPLCPCPLYPFCFMLLPNTDKN